MSLLITLLQGTKASNDRDLAEFQTKLKEVVHNLSKMSDVVYRINLAPHHVTVFRVISGELGFGFCHVARGDCTYCISKGRLAHFENQR